MSHGIKWTSQSRLTDLDFADATSRNKRNFAGHDYKPNNARAVLRRTTKFGRITRGEGCISRGSPTQG